jgi:two-component system CheB/CheR fusion protein
MTALPDDSAPVSDRPSEVRLDGLPAISPDEREAELQEQIDNIVPTRGYRAMPLVGLGGSAGAITAIKQYLEAAPVDAGIAYAVVLHLSPEHESILPEMFQRCTTMPVHQAEDGQKVEADTVYVIPPGKHLTVTEGHLRLTPLDRVKGRRVAVDMFLRSLADTHGPHGIAIVFSGADGDGALGLKRIKERGGLTIAQEPDEAEHTGMPCSAIATGMVDWVLRAAEMPAKVRTYLEREQQLRLPPEEGPQPAKAPGEAGDDAEAALRELLVHLRTRTGHDFTCYKRATILRRIARRMQVNGVNDLPAYLAYLRTHPGEAGALLKDFLISVTNFFRDREAFAALEQRIPKLFEGKTQDDVVRVWVPAVATGEEAYSMAILLMEHACRLDFPPAIQVFACDLDEEAIEVARAGVYPETIVADVSEERLRQWFVHEHRGWRVRRELREILLFAAHDVLRDAPFSRMDLISCRNLLIYLDGAAQARLLNMFHFALRPAGLLFLGTSETVEEGSHLFDTLDKKHRLYQHQPFARSTVPISTSISRLIARVPELPAYRARPVLPGPSFALTAGIPPATVRRVGAGGTELRPSLSDLHFSMLERFAPPSLIINGDHEIVHLSEKAGRFLQFAAGEPTRNLLRMIHPDLRVELRAAIFRATQSGQPAESFRIPLVIEGEKKTVRLRVMPAPELAPNFLLVVFDVKDPGAPEAPSEPGGAVGAEGGGAAVGRSVSEDLELELEQLKSHLCDTVEQYEASTEELKASNEELQAMNEELRSATEELETSREELQSVNEELTTVNQELKAKVDELGNANSDLHNLMASTAIATVFVDRELRIMRYTPPAVELFNLIGSDVGRPLTDLKHELDYDVLVSDAHAVLERLIPMEREIAASDGRTFLVRLLPYRTLEDRIAGVVLNFVDITERKRAEAELQVRHAELERFNSATVGRELRMVELKKEINRLLVRLGETARYLIPGEKL